MASVYGGDCGDSTSGYTNILAGSVVRIFVKDLTGKPDTVLVEGWPQGYSFQFALDIADRDNFKGSPELDSSLTITPYISPLAKYAKSYYESTGEDPGMEALRQKNFLLQVPDSLAGHLLMIRASYSDDTTNTLFSNVGGPLSIISPCSVDDSARILSSEIWAVAHRGLYREAVALADSMHELGWADPVAWQWGVYCARNIRDYKKQLLYFDRLFMDYGITSLMQRNPLEQHRISDGNYDPVQLELYEIRREQILQSIEATNQSGE